MLPQPPAQLPPEANISVCGLALQHYRHKCLWSVVVLAMLYKYTCAQRFYSSTLPAHSNKLPGTLKFCWLTAYLGLLKAATILRAVSWFL